MTEGPVARSDVAEILGEGASSGRRRNLNKWLLVAGLVIGTAVTAGFWKSKGKSPAFEYKTQQVQRGYLTVTATATGTLQPTVQVDVGSELSGIIQTVEVDYNDRVKVGQILARLDTSKLEALVTQSRAVLEAAKAKVSQAQATVSETGRKLDQLHRVRELSEGKVPSQAEFDAAVAAFERAKADEASARASVLQAQAALEAYETDLSKSLIRSPIKGIVLTRKVEPGQTVAASFETPVLFTLAEDLTQMELHVDVDEADVGKVHAGQEATFTVSAYPNRFFDARITQVRYGSKTTSGVVTYEAVLEVHNPDLSLRPGMTATAEITVQKVENALLVPSAALRFSPPAPEEKKKPSEGLIGALLPRPPTQDLHARANKKEQRVWTLQNGQLRAIPVTIGSTDGSMTEVVSGDLQPGMAVVVDILPRGE